MPDPNTAAAYALQPGETTSEYKTMQEGSSFARWLTIISAVTALLPQLADMTNMLPESVKQNPHVLTVLAVLGGLGAILGIVKETLLKVGYSQSRALIKAAAVRDVAPSTTLPTPPAV